MSTSRLAERIHKPRYQSNWEEISEFDEFDDSDCYGRAEKDIPPELEELEFRCKRK